MIGPVGRERSFAGALHQGSHVLQSFSFFFFFLPSRIPPGKWPLLQLPFTFCSLTPQRSLFPPPRPLSHFPVHLTRGKKKSHRINPPTNFSSLPRSTSVLSAILYSSLLPALVPAYGLCFLFLLADLAYPYGDLFT